MKVSLVGETFGRLTVLKRAKPTGSQAQNNSSYWLCQCQCGKKTYKWGHNLVGGKSRSCGCYRRHVLKTRPHWSVGLSERKLAQLRKNRKDNYVPQGTINFREARIPVNVPGALTVKAIRPFTIQMPLQSAVI